MGYRAINAAKTLFHDGHERKDVKEFLREVYLPTIQYYQRLVCTYAGEDMEQETQPEGQKGVAEHIFVWSDETTSQKK